MLKFDCRHDAQKPPIAKVHYVTIIPSGEFAGRCVRSGPPSSFNLLDDMPAPTTDEIVDICTRLEKLTPEIGARRVEDAEGHIRCQVNCIELLGGSAAERILHPDLPVLPAEHDLVEARAFAAVACATPRAVDALLEYASVEAEALIRENLDIVRALVDAILERGNLTGDEVDTTIAAGMAKRLADAEMCRHRDWQQRTESARAFLADAKP
jgi:hypothetical protein